MAVDMLKKTLYDPFDGRKDLKDLVSCGVWNGKPGKWRRSAAAVVRHTKCTYMIIYVLEWMKTMDMHIYKKKIAVLRKIHRSCININPTFLVAILF